MPCWRIAQQVSIVRSRQMIRHVLAVAATITAVINLAPAPASAQITWLERSPFSGNDGTRRWWRQGALNETPQSHGGYQPNQDRWHNPRNEHNNWRLGRFLDGWRDEYRRGRYARHAYGGPRYAIRPMAPPFEALRQVQRPGTVYVDLKRHRLYYVLSPWRAHSYPISIGRSALDWTGTLRITAVENWPDLILYPNKRKGLKDRAWMPERLLGGTDNPLGAKALYLGDTGCTISGTNAPNTMGKRTRGGCFRMRNEQVVHLAELVNIGTTVHIVRHFSAARGQDTRPLPRRR
ncbi:MAG: lipoprotein-anchoring transpeptidase ErfK/SrfK [Hyphomicrobiaceae bacterium]|jgi:lipoprotein-anchoring transpeptidase ErfK/SrfK